MADRNRYRTVVGDVDDVAWCDIFNTPAYYRLDLHERNFYFRLLGERSGRVAGVAHFSEVEPGLFRSPSRGTYGGIDALEADLGLIDGFVGDIDDTLVREGARQISITAAPFAHDPAKSALLFDCLRRRGYVVETCALNYTVGVDNDDLIKKMRRNNRKRLRKCQRTGFSFFQGGLREAKVIYDVIARNRSFKGYSLSMSYERVLEMADHFPAHLFFFGINEGTKVVAGAICVRLNPRVLYAAYWGDLHGYERFSPITLLADGIYRFARSNGYALLDTGTVPDSAPNRGLIRFKEGLGFAPSLKLTYVKRVHGA
jgi:hypothetical protein